MAVFDRVRMYRTDLRASRAQRAYTKAVDEWLADCNHALI